MRSPDRLRASRLLSKQEGPSRVEKEEILSEVLDRTVPAPGSTSWLARLGFGARTWRIGALGAVVASVAVAVLFLPPLVFTPPEFVARGVAEEFAVEARCVGGTCTRGERLLFEVTADPKYRYVAAFARRPDGAVLWYYPENEGASSAAIGELSAIVLGGEHTPGDYALTVVVSEQPLDRPAIKTLISSGADMNGAAVQEHILRVR